MTYNREGETLNRILDSVPGSTNKLVAWTEAIYICAERHTQNQEKRDSYEVLGKWLWSQMMYGGIEDSMEDLVYM